MLKQNIKNNHHSKDNQLTHSGVELVNWPLSSSLDEKVFALQTTCHSPLFNTTHIAENIHHYDRLSAESPFGYFNLGLHVGDDSNNVIQNRGVLGNFIRQFSPTLTGIQWLEQVHGNDVVDIINVTEKPITADACITREKNIALAIMTADCLPILLSHKAGMEIAAIHGGWRPLAANIIEKTIMQMHSAAGDIVAWLGPCIGKEVFEVGGEVKDAFLELNQNFESSFIAKADGKYLADLHQIAKTQLQLLGISLVSTLAECTYSTSDKYYSYRKKQVTGRMASVICRR